MSQNNAKAYIDGEGGTSHASRHNLDGAAMLSMNSGATAPTYAEDGTLWADNSASSGEILIKQMWDSQWITIFTINPSSSAGSDDVVMEGQANSVVDQGGSGSLLCKVIEIGDWDMDASSFVSFTHELTAGSIRSVDASVRADNGTWMKFITGNLASGTIEGAIEWNTTVINLKRRAGGLYDSTSYDSIPSAGYNRGYITILYTE